MNMIYFTLAGFTALVSILYLIEKYYRSFKFEERKEAWLTANAERIILEREERFMLQKLIRSQVKKSDEWKEFLKRKKMGKSIDRNLREDISNEITSTTFKVERELAGTFRQTIDSDDLRLIEESMYL